jgi:hypothetical protein
MDYDDYISYRDQIIDIAEDMTEAKVAYDGERITVIKDDSIGHFQIDRNRNRDSFKLYDGHLHDDIGARVDPILSTDGFNYAKQEWRVYLDENIAKDEE